MKIVLIGAHYSIHFRRWVDGLRGRGHEIYQVTLDRHLDANEPFEGPGFVLSTRRPNPAEILRLRREVNSFEPDICHAHYVSSYGQLLPLFPRPHVISVWGSDVYEVPFRSRVHRELIRSALKRSDLVLATSHAMRHHVRDKICRVPITVTPFGVDTDVFVPPATSLPHDPERPITIGAFRSHYEVYGLDLLLEAFELCQRATGQPLRLVLGGDGPQTPALKQRAISLGIQEQCTFLGKLSEAQVVSNLQQVDIAALPSRRESFGVAALEAAACSVPVIASSVGGLPEVVCADKTGLLAAPEDISALSMALNELVEDPDKRSRFGAAGRSMVVAEYSWRLSIERMLDAYDLILRTRCSGH